MMIIDNDMMKTTTAEEKEELETASITDDSHQYEMIHSTTVLKYVPFMAS